MFCGTVTANPQCQSAEAAFCLLSGDDGEYQLTAARWRRKDDVFMAETTATGVHVEFHNALDTLFDDVYMHVVVNCAETAGSPVAHRESSATSDKINVYFTIDSPAGCKVSAESGLSGGSIFLIVFTSLILAYIVAGCCINWRRNGLALGREACPNREMWCKLRDNCVAGVMFTRNGCKRSGTYHTSSNDTGHNEL